MRRTAFTEVATTTPVDRAASGTIISYDYAATFKLTGRPGNIIHDVINISPEGAFIATAMGYGLEEERGRPVEIPRQGTALLKDPFLPSNITLDQIPQEALIEGFRVNPRFESNVFTDPVPMGTTVRERELLNQPLPATFGKTLLHQVKKSEEISFLFSIIDTASGRELQDEPIHNLASLGKSNGERPFRLLAKPLSFQPRSTVRLQIIERSEGVRGILFIVLYGYKILQVSHCPEPLMRRLRGSPACRIESVGYPEAPIIPFDYVAKLELVGRARNLVEEEVSINAEGGFVATALGYGLVVNSPSVPLDVSSLIRTRNGQSVFGLSQVQLGSFPPSALSDGVRIRSEFLRLAFMDNGDLATDLPVELAGKMFERLNRTDDVSFRYTLFDTGRGRELQNQRIHNIAGLGIANGHRPFKTFARPMVFLPRSTIRITVEEHFGRGTLFLVFQGYKVLRNMPLRGGR
jgi:hypothetical protein